MTSRDTTCTSKRYNAETYNEASDIYDTYEGLFFPYLFGRIQQVLQERFMPSLPRGAKVLDVGCGTGQQTRLFRQRGYEVVGIDISAGLVKVACKKLGENVCLVSDACRLPFPDGYFDAVSSAGSTLNHIPDYDLFFNEITRVLKPGGFIFLESDNKWRPDMLWCLLSAATGDPLKYHESPDNVISYFKRPLDEGYPYVFPLAFDENKVRLLNLRTFTYPELDKELYRCGCSIISTIGIHSVTNIIPSPFMLQDKPGQITKDVFGFLRWIEDHVYDVWPLNRLGMSIAVIAKKKDK